MSDTENHLREQLSELRTRLTAEIQRCGRAEGALSMVEQQLATALKRIATLTAERDALRGELGDMRDERDNEPQLSVREEIGKREGRTL